MDDAPSWAGQGWKDPCLNSSPEKLNPGRSAQNSQGTFPMVGVASPKTASLYHYPSRKSTGVSKCAKLCLELLNVHLAHESGGAGLLRSLAQIPLKTEPGPFCLKLTVDLSPTKDHLP